MNDLKKIIAKLILEIEKKEDAQLLNESDK